MNLNMVKDEIIDLHNDYKFQKLASFVASGKITPEEGNIDLEKLMTKQAYAEDSTYADPLNRMFSIASPIETKISALYAEKCAAVLDTDVIDRINDACRIYELGISVPSNEKVATVVDDPEVLEAIELFDKNYVDPEIVYTRIEKHANTDGYGNQLNICLAARQYYATKPEEVEALDNLAKIAHQIEPIRMVGLLHEIDSELGLDMPRMQNLVGTPEYAVYEKVASENLVNLGECAVPLSIIDEHQDEIKDLGVELDWDGASEDALTLQIEKLPDEIKEEIASICGN